jgi:predicted DNA-binding transcriptional regulator YafY
MSNPAFVPTEASTQLNLPSSDILACITRAIHNKQAIRINYLSLSSGLSQREIVPHTLVDNGLRWHVRGFDRQRQKFSDFVINRIDKPSLLTGNIIADIESKAADLQWHRIIELKLVPHPTLQHPETVEYEYGMANGLLSIQVRAAVAGDVLRHWNVDCSENHALTGGEYHLWLKNAQALNGVENFILTPDYPSEVKGKSDIE